MNNAALTRRQQWETDTTTFGERVAWHLLMEHVEPEATIGAAVAEAVAARTAAVADAFAELVGGEQWADVDHSDTDDVDLVSLLACPPAGCAAIAALWERGAIEFDEFLGLVDPDCEAYGDRGPIGLAGLQAVHAALGDYMVAPDAVAGYVARLLEAERP